MVFATGSLLGKRPVEAIEEAAVHVKRQRCDSESSASSASECSANDSETNPCESGTRTPHTPATPSSPRKTTGPRPKSYCCTYQGCGKSFTRPVRLEEHERSHTGARPFRCPENGCDKDFQRQSHLKRHVKSAHTGERDYECDQPGCAKKFATGTRLRRHKETVHDNINTFMCVGFPPCEQAFRKHATLQRHIDAVHYGLSPFQCRLVDHDTGAECLERFDTAAKLHSHERKIHGSATVTFACTTCNARLDEESDRDKTAFETYHELQRHIKAVHPPICAHCQYSARSMGDLQKHIDFRHADQAVEDRKVFPCDWIGCKKYFTRKANLLSHIKTTHEKQKPFKCGATDLSSSKGLEAWPGTDACGHTFAHKATLEDHVRKVHLGMRDQAKKSKPCATQAVGDSGWDSLKLLTGETNTVPLTIRCPDHDCEQMLLDTSGLQLHLRLVHGWEDNEAEEAVAEEEALRGGKFWMGGSDADFDDNMLGMFRQAAGLAPLAGNDDSSGFAVDPELTADNVSV